MVDQDYIRHQVAMAVKNRSVNNQILNEVVPPTERSKFLGHFLVSCIVLLSIATISGLFVKAYHKRTPIAETIVEKYMTQTDGANLLSTIDGRISALESSQRKWNNRVWLLGIAHNENATMNAAIQKKYHPNEPSDHMLFEKNWKINRMPRSLDADSETTERLKENLSK